MGPAGSEEHCWAIEPLLAAGLPLEEIRTLVVLLAAEADVGTPQACVTGLVRDRSSEVQAAWAETVGRLLQLGDRAEGPLAR